MPESHRKSSGAEHPVGSAEHLWLAVRAAKIGLWDWDIVANTVFYSPEWKQQIGYEVHEISDSFEEWRSRVHPDDLPDIMRALEARVAKSSGDFEAEFRFRHRDGSYRSILAQGAVIADSRGKAVRMLGSHIDVTERRRVEAQLQRTEQQFRGAVENAPFPILIHAEDGTVLTVNHAWCEITGYSREELRTIGDWTERAYGTRRQRVRAEIDSLFELSGRKAEGEYVVTCKDGSSRVWDFSSGALGRTPAGLRTVISMAVDVTARRAAESEVRRLNENLERRVAERTEELAALNRELEAFAYSVSHDLKAPLRGIDGYSQILLEDYSERFDEEGRRLLGKVRGGAAQLSLLIDDLLSYARMERKEMRARPVDVRRVVRSVIAARAHAIEEQQAQLNIQLPALKAKADSAALAHVFGNLIDNALKFSRDRNPPVIEIGGRDSEGRYLIWVKDNGIGFDMKFHDKIFQLFQRLERAERYAGTGVGLAIVRKVMDRLGGRAWAESEPGKGATFFLECPLDNRESA